MTASHRAPHLPALISTLSFCAAAIVASMFALYVVTGVGQDGLQVVSAPADYAAILLKDPIALKIVLGLDNLFILFYLPMFLALGAVLSARPVSRSLLIAGIALIVAAGILDLIENMHFRTLLGDAELGLAIDQGAINFQVVESLAKFHLSYVALFLLSFVLPRTTMLEKLVVIAFRWVQAPIGILIYVVPAAIAPLLLIGRFGFFFVALTAFGVMFRRISGSDAPA